MQKGTRKNVAAKRDDFFKNLLGGLQHNDFFAGDQCQNGVRRLLDELDEIRVDDQGLVVEARELDHDGSNGAQSWYRKGAPDLADFMASDGPRLKRVRKSFPRQIGSCLLAKCVQI